MLPNMHGLSVWQDSKIDDLLVIEITLKSHPTSSCNDEVGYDIEITFIMKKKFREQKYIHN